MPILLAQRDRARDELIAQLKAEGVPYEDRIRRLESVSWPQPEAEFIAATFRVFAENHPWVGEADIHPKGVAREMFEGCQGFVDRVRELGVGRSEGTAAALPLAGARHAGAQPAGCRQDRCRLRRDRLLPHADPGRRREPAAGLAGAARAGGRRRARGAASALRSGPARARAAGAHARRAAPPGARARSQGLGGGGGLRAPAPRRRLGRRIASSRRSRRSSRSTASSTSRPRARLAHRTRIAAAGPRRWQVAQVLVDPAGDELWALHGEVDLSREKDPEGPLVRLLRIGP